MPFTEYYADRLPVIYEQQTTIQCPFRQSLFRHEKAVSRQRLQRGTPDGGYGTEGAV